MLREMFYRGPSIGTLHEDYAKKGRIDTAAPVQGQAEVHIAATPERVFAVLSDPRGWHTVQPAIHDVRLDGEPAADSSFTWVNGRARISSRFAVVQPAREVTWTGISAGAKAVHRHILQPADGGTRLYSEESMGGPLISVLFPSTKLHTALLAWLDALTNAAERQ